MNLEQVNKLMDKYTIPDIKYLEKCIIDHDKYGELNERVGCPLNIFIKLLTKQTCYFKLFDEDTYKIKGVVDMRYIDLENKTFRVWYENVTDSDDYAVLRFEDHKKNWWLTE